MSWQEKINTPCIIRTGDGKEYRPFWKPTDKTLDFNVSEFEFPEVPGTKVDKREPKGLRHEILIYFQGDDHLDLAEAFRISSNDKRPWNMSHPFFGNIICHPIQLKFGQSVLNVTEISGVVVETISGNFPKVKTVPADELNSRNSTLTDTVSRNFSNNVSLSAGNISGMQKTNKLVYTESARIAPTNDIAEEYFNTFSNAEREISLGISDAGGAINGMSSVINAPALFSTNVFTRLSLFQSNLTALITNLGPEPSSEEKKIFEANGTVLMGAVAVASVNPVGNNYANAVSIFRAIDLVSAMFNQYFTQLSAIQNTSAFDPGSFVPDADTIRMISNMIGYAISNLFDLSLDALQERQVVLEYDSNLISLTHRFYGLDEDDVNLNRLAEENGIGLNSIYGIKKNTVISYFV